MEPAFYRQYAELEQRHWWFVGRRAIVAETLRRQVGSGPLAMLDFGCGTGGNLATLGRFGEVDAVDGDERAIRFCRGRGYVRVQHVPADAALPFLDGRFDVVTALDVLEHIEDDDAALRDLFRVLRPGGTLLATVPAFPLLWGDQDEISRHFRRYRARPLEGLARSAGFEIRHVSHFNAALFPAIAAIRIGRRAVQRPSSDRTDFTIGGERSNRALTKLFAAEAPLVARRRVPFGVSLMLVARRPLDSAAAVPCRIGSA